MRTARRRGRRTLQYLWNEWASWQPERWSLDLAVIVDGRLVGTQNVRARDFARRREVQTGMWIFQNQRGQGHGTRSRAAVVHLAFAGLGAHRALYAVDTDNAPARAVAAKMGY